MDIFIGYWICLNFYFFQLFLRLPVFFLVIPEVKVDPCNPSPCGPNSECRVRNGNYVCSCKQNYFGNPPDCRPECVVNSDCDDDKACVRQKCIDPCPGICGIDALCEVKNHNPICFCPSHLTGDPFVRCIPFKDRKYIRHKMF